MTWRSSEDDEKGEKAMLSTVRAVVQPNVVGSDLGQPGGRRVCLPTRRMTLATLLVTTRSTSRSLFRSAVSRHDGARSAAKDRAAVNVPSPFPSRTETSSVRLLEVAMSGRPSRLKSAVTRSYGAPPAGTSTCGANETAATCAIAEIADPTRQIALPICNYHLAHDVLPPEARFGTPVPTPLLPSGAPASGSPRFVRRVPTSLFEFDSRSRPSDPPTERSARGRAGHLSWLIPSSRPAGFPDLHPVRPVSFLCFHLQSGYPWDDEPAENPRRCPAAH